MGRPDSAAEAALDDLQWRSPYGDGGGLPASALVSTVELETWLPGSGWDPGISL